MAHNGSDAAWFDSEPPAPSRPRPRGMRYSSRYLTMRDGVRIAISRYLPDGMTYAERLPTILHQTRYYRSMELRQPMRSAASGQTFHHIPLAARTRKRFVANGYGWIDVDVRGSGASYGTRLCEWSPDEIRDSAEIVDWIIGQPWSNGIVGALGTSYNGAAAEFVAANRHPAVRAIAPRFSPFDAYTDIAFPGGIHAAWFTQTWGRYNDALDRNAPEEVVGRWLKLLVTGVQPVQGDEHRALRAGAIAAHAGNYDVHEQALSLTFRDDIAVSDPYRDDRGVRLDPIGTPIDDAGSINLFSPHNYWRAVEASGAPVYNYSGWFDGGYAHSAIKRFLTNTTAGSRLILGPWNHGGRWQIDPVGKPATSAFDHDGELLRFFDRHLRQRDTGIDAEPRVHYFTMVQNRWKAADSWPPPADTLSYFLSADRGLGLEPADSDSGADDYLVDLSAGTGEHSRWHTQVAIGAAVRYPDREAQDAKLLTYTSAPIGPALEVTGHPIVTLYVSANAGDATIFVYLEDIDARGHATYVTEGQLRAINRRLSDAPPPYRQPVPYRTFKRGDAQPLVAGAVAELTFDLLPTSYLFGPGHRIRIAIAGADASHFAVLPGGPPALAVHRSRLHASRLDLPVVRR